MVEYLTCQWVLIFLFKFVFVTLINNEQFIDITKNKNRLLRTQYNSSKYVNRRRKLNSPTSLWLFDNRTKAKRKRIKDYTNQLK